MSIRYRNIWFKNVCTYFSFFSLSANTKIVLKTLLVAHFWARSTFDNDEWILVNSADPFQRNCNRHKNKSAL